jgi:mannose/cellobiose epimerase-like protein (N-acyl-D-glucosamine 2-epimerase family)
MAHEQLDRHVPWFRTLLLDDLLPRWLQHAATGEGLFLVQLDRGWRPVPPLFGTAVSQSRVLHNLAVGYRLTGEQRYLDALTAGALFLLDGFRDPKNGGWYHSVGPGGEVIDPHKNSYDFAFIIFGLAHAAEVTGDERFKAGMLEAWEILDSRFRDEHGGFIRVMTPDYQPNEARRTQNPTMHLFEALLAAAQIEPAMMAHAEQAGRFVVGRLMNWDGQPCMPEYYDLDWKPLPIDAGGSVCLGHQFEWAYLLSLAVERGLPGWWLSPATDLLQYGMRAAYDPEHGGVAAWATYRGEVTSPAKGWWEQCEAIRAMLRFAALHGRDDLWGPVDKCIEFCDANFIDHEYGGWHSSIKEPPTDTSPPKGNGFKVDYHVVGMCVEALRL